MSLFGEFYVPAESFALQHTLEELPKLVIEVERVVATDEVLTPYFWVTGDDLEVFEMVAETDPSVHALERLDAFDKSALFRAEWTDNINAVVYAYTQINATILEASGQESEWELRMRFDDHKQLEQFQNYCDEQEIPFQLSQLHELTQPRTGSQYGLTSKQYDALVTAWEMDYFISSNVSLTDVADELGISQQSLSDRFRRGNQSLIEHTLLVTSP